MTGIRDVAARGGLLESRTECVQAGETHDAHEKEKCEANFEKPLLCFFAGDDAPLRAEKPDSIGEVPGGGYESNNVENEQERRVNFGLHFRE